MKNSRILILSVAVLGLGLTANFLRAQPAEYSSAVIVIRHAEDAIKGVGSSEKPFEGKPANGQTPAVDPWPSKDWDAATAERWPDYPHPFVFIGDSGEAKDANENGFRIASHALSGYWQTADGRKGTAMKGGKEGPLGEKQAISLGKNLGELLLNGHLFQIDRAITMDPRENDSTPNPFDTIWPYLRNRQLDQNWVELYLVMRDKNSNDKFPGIMSLIQNDKVLPEKIGSTLICWTGEGMMGKEADGKGTDGILAKLIKKYRGSIGPSYDGWVNGPIERCADVFVFYLDANGKGVAEKWKFDYSKGSFERKERHADD
jgi:hypothetical protein